MTNIVPIPERLEPKKTSHRLMTAVRGYFYSLYNDNSDSFRKFLASVDNKTAITGNRQFDRKEAVDMIVMAAKDAKDAMTAKAKAGDIYHCLVNAMREHPELKLRLRRQEYQRLSQAAD